MKVLNCHHDVTEIALLMLIVLYVPCAGPPKTFEVVGAEQVSGTDISSTQAPAVKRAPTTTSTAAAPAGADTDELRAKAAGTLQDTKEGIKARVQVRVVRHPESSLGQCYAPSAQMKGVWLGFIFVFECGTAA